MKWLNGDVAARLPRIPVDVDAVAVVVVVHETAEATEHRIADVVVAVVDDAI